MTSCRNTASPRAPSCARCRKPWRRSASRIRCICIATISALPATSRPRSPRSQPAGDLPLHLAHLQFYAYGTEGARGFSSAAAASCGGASTRTQNITADVGQVMFGQTVTISSRRAPPVQRAARRRIRGNPSSWTATATAAASCRTGIARNNFFNAVQWAAGLELFLLDRRSVAALLHHGPPERRAVHRLSRICLRC